MALFGEKYGDVVRVVSVDDFSCELCGGSHVDNTSVIGSFRITGESGTGSGVRRIEAVTGAAALALAKDESRELQQLADMLKAKVGDTTAKLEALLAQAKGLEKELAQLKKEAAMSDLDSILAGKEDIGGVSVITAEARLIPWTTSAIWPTPSSIRPAAVSSSWGWFTTIKLTSSAKSPRPT